eukprot:4544818-Amphidinium_carterae.3
MSEHSRPSVASSPPLAVNRVVRVGSNIHTHGRAADCHGGKNANHRSVHTLDLRERDPRVAGVQKMARDLVKPICQSAGNAKRDSIVIVTAMNKLNMDRRHAAN